MNICKIYILMKILNIKNIADRSLNIGQVKYFAIIFL